VLDSGLTVGRDTGCGSVQADGTTIDCVSQWEFPVDLAEIAAVQIGETEIPVP